MGHVRMRGRSLRSAALVSLVVAAALAAVRQGIAAGDVRNAVATIPAHAPLALPADINVYADLCACEMGAGEGAYMPEGIMPDSDCMKVIPVYWNKKLVTYAETDPTTGAPSTGSGHWEFLFDGQPGSKTAGSEWPDKDNRVGRIMDKEFLKCDYWPHVDTANSGCVPGQRAGQITVGGVTWTFVFRREQPPKAGAAWGAFHPRYFQIMDVAAFKADTGAVCWFDTLVAGGKAGGCTTSGKLCATNADCPGTQTCTNPAPNGRRSGMTKDNWWVGPPDGIPRPGGKDPAKVDRALDFWDTPANLAAGGGCTLCHGNGPFLSSRWINQDGAVPIGDDSKEFWSAAGLIPDLKFFYNAVDGAGDAASCDSRSCHKLWAQKTASCPGGLIADAMTSVPTKTIASNYRKQSGIDPDKQDAGVIYEMPDRKRFNGNPKAWEKEHRADYNLMKTCCDTNTSCGNTYDPERPNFYGPQNEVPADPKQLIDPPDTARFDVEKFNCVIAANGSETCDYKAVWIDPKADHRVPSSYFLEKKTASNAAGTPDPTAPAYCTGNTDAGGTTKAFEGSVWRKRHEVKDSIPACTKIAFRLCGEGCTPKSRDEGTSVMISTACANP